MTAPDTNVSPKMLAFALWGLAVGNGLGFFVSTLLREKPSPELRYQMVAGYGDANHIATDGTADEGIQPHVDIPSWHEQWGREDLSSFGNHYPICWMLFKGDYSGQACITAKGDWKLSGLAETDPKRFWGLLWDPRSENNI